MNGPSPSTTFVWHGGGFRQDATLPVADRGFRYGMAVFETIALRDGRPLFLKDHLVRLQEGAAAAGFPIPSGALEAASNKLRSTALTGIGRLHVTAGPGDFDAPSLSPNFILTFDQKAPLPDSRRAAGYSLHPVPQPSAPPHPGLKTSNYWTNIRALKTAHDHGCDEGLLTDFAGHLTGAAMANLFMISEGQLLTPPPADGARRGVIREWVMSRRPVKERSLSPDDLVSADEIFLTSSGLGVMPVTRLGDHPTASRHVADELCREYEAAVAP